jgi:serine/threonine-protein kinase
MTTTDLGACEWLVWDLRRSNLVDRGKLEQIISEFVKTYPRGEPQQLTDFLVERQVLSRFQADSLLNNKASGLVMGPFVVMDVLGTGSMGTVYRAQSKANGEWYAVKVLPRRSMWNIRVAKRKVRDFEQIKHPAVVPFLDVGTSGSTHYLAWPFVEGDCLTKVVEARGRMTAGETALYGMQIAEGLEACHQKGILHGLLKPSNLLITQDNQVKILDFGVGSLIGETESESVVDTMSTANTMAGSLECASPESIMDPTSVSPASDQYSLGCVMYFLLAGQYPFPGANAVEKMMQHQMKEPTPLGGLAPEAPVELITIVEKVMRKNPADRYGSMTDVVIALRPLALGGLTAVATQSLSMMRLPSAHDLQPPPAPWPSGSPGNGRDTPQGEGVGQPRSAQPPLAAPPPMATIAPPGRSSRTPGTHPVLPPLPQPGAVTQPPIPIWQNQAPNLPQPKLGSGGYVAAPPPMPHLPGRDLCNQPPPYEQAPLTRFQIVVLMIFAIAASMAAGAALVWFLK